MPEVAYSNGWKVDGIVDTGAEKFLSLDRLFFKNNINKASYIRLVAENGSKIDVISEVTLYIGIKKIPWRFLVVKNL